MTDSMDKMLTDLRDTANVPIERAKALSPLIYTSQEFYELEREKIFAKDWQCVGRIEQNPEPDDYITSTLDTVPAYTINVGGASLRHSAIRAAIVMPYSWRERAMPA